MQAHHSGLSVTDLSNAVSTMSAAEVTKMFVDSTSYILRAAVGGSGSTVKRDPIKGDKPLWD